MQVSSSQWPSSMQGTLHTGPLPQYVVMGQFLTAKLNISHLNTGTHICSVVSYKAASVYVMSFSIRVLGAVLSQGRVPWPGEDGQRDRTHRAADVTQPGTRTASSSHEMSAEKMA